MPGGSQFLGVQIEGSGLDTELRPTRWCLDPESAGRWGGEAGDSLQVIWATVRRREKGGPGPGRAGRGDTAQDRVTVDAEEREASVGGTGALQWRGPGWRRPRQGARGRSRFPRPSGLPAAPTLLSWCQAGGGRGVGKRPTVGHLLENLGTGKPSSELNAQGGRFGKFAGVCVRGRGA